MFERRRWPVVAVLFGAWLAMFVTFFLIAMMTVISHAFETAVAGRFTWNDVGPLALAAAPLAGRTAMIFSLLWFAVVFGAAWLAGRLRTDRKRSE